MANTTRVAATAATVPSRDEIARVEEWTREPLAYDEEALKPGTAIRRAFDTALAEIEAGNEVPSIEWRQQFSLMLGLERLLSEDQPKLADGAELSAHQVDVLSGTLTALIAEAERQNGHHPEAETPDVAAAVEDGRKRSEAPGLLDADESENGKLLGDGDLETEDEDWLDDDVAANGQSEDEEEQLPEQPEDPSAAR